MGDATWFDRLRHVWPLKARCWLTHRDGRVNCHSGWHCRFARAQRIAERTR